MILNLHILREDLPGLELKGSILHGSETGQYFNTLFCDEPPAKMNENVLFVMSAAVLPPRKSIPGTPSVVCVGIPDEDWLCEASNILYTEQPISPVSLFHIITEWFVSYQYWERAMQEVVDLRLPVKEFAIRSEALIHNPIAAERYDFLMLFTHIPKSDSPSLKRYYEAYRDEYIEQENTYLNWEQMEHLVNAVGDTPNGISSPFLLSYRDSTFQTMCCCYCAKGDVVCRVYIDEVVEPFKARDYFLIGEIVYFLALYFDNKVSYPENKVVFMEPVLRALLDNRSVPVQQVSSLLRQLNWNEHDSYICIQIRTRGMQSISAIQRMYAKIFRSQFGDTCYHIYEENILYVFNLSAADVSQSDFLKYMEYFSKRQNICIGIGNCFTYFMDIQSSAQQAKFALEHSLEDLRYGAFCFKDLYVKFWEEKVLGSPRVLSLSSSLIPEGLNTLIEYDKRKGTSFAGLLRLYLEKERNIAETTRAAFMHRSTFLYQLQKIQALLGMDLDDPDIRLTLLMAYRLLDIKTDN